MSVLGSRKKAETKKKDQDEVSLRSPVFLPMPNQRLGSAQQIGGRSSQSTPESNRETVLYIERCSRYLAVTSEVWL